MHLRGGHRTYDTHWSTNRKREASPSLREHLGDATLGVMGNTVDWARGDHVVEELRAALLDEAAARESQRNVRAAVALAEVSCASAEARCKRIRESGRYAIVRDVRVR